MAAAESKAVSMDYRVEAEEHRDWTAVEYDFLDAVVNKLLSLYDYLHFSLVCKSWYSVAFQNRRQRSIISSNLPQLPMLVVPSKDGIHNKHCLYDLRNNQVRHVDFKFPYDKRCCGSSYGWLFLLEETMNITLFNPFSGALVCLPQITRDPVIDSEDEESEDEESFVDYRSHVLKAILTKDPSVYPNDYMVAVIYGRTTTKLCVVKASDKVWTYLNPNDRKSTFGDVNVHNNTIYALNDAMVLWKVEVYHDSTDGNSTFYNLKRVTPELNLEGVYQGQVYLAESTGGELLLVKRSIEEHGPSDSLIFTWSETLNFHVFKLTLECEDGMQRHIEVESLDDDAMFIGDNHSMCVSTKNFPKCLPNRIYYTDNNYFSNFILLDGSTNAGIFGLEDRSFDTHYIMDGAHKDLPPPIWIVPTICFKELENSNSCDR